MNFEELITLLNDNPELSNKIRDAVSPKASYEIAKEAGFVGTFEEYVQNMQNLYENATQLDDNDLDAITGGASRNKIAEPVGISPEDAISISTVVAAGTATSCAATAAM